MLPVGSYDRMKIELYWREQDKGTDIPITVGILVADCRSQFGKEKVFNQLARLDKKSGPLIDFYIPGYSPQKDVPSWCSDDFTFKRRAYVFSPKLFDEFVEKLEEQGIKITGQTQLILLPYENGHLLVNQAICFDLESAERDGKIESTKLFFDSIFKIARKTTEFKEFKARIGHDRALNWFGEFLKENLPGTLWSLLTDPFLK